MKDWVKEREENARKDAQDYWVLGNCSLALVRTA